MMSVSSVLGPSEEIRRAGPNRPSGPAAAASTRSWQNVPHTNPWGVVLVAALGPGREEMAAGSGDEHVGVGGPAVRYPPEGDRGTERSAGRGAADGDVGSSVVDDRGAAVRERSLPLTVDVAVGRNELGRRPAALAGPHVGADGVVVLDHQPPLAGAARNQRDVLDDVPVVGDHGGQGWGRCSAGAQLAVDDSPAVAEHELGDAVGTDPEMEHVGARIRRPDLDRRRERAAGGRNRTQTLGANRTSGSEISSVHATAGAGAGARRASLATVIHPEATQGAGNELPRARRRHPKREAARHRLCTRVKRQREANTAGSPESALSRRYRTVPAAPLPPRLPRARPHCRR
jgi:hypothetical protein